MNTDKDCLPCGRLPTMDGMHMNQSLRLLFFGMVALSGCGERIAVDQARVCFSAEFDATEDPQLQADEALVLFAMASAGCHTEDLAVSCQVERDGDTLFVTTETTWRRTEPLALSCEAVLMMTTTSCETDEPLAAGAYTVVYGDEELDIEIPSDAGDLPCLEGIQ